MPEPRPTLAQLNYEPPIWGLDDYMALRRAEPRPLTYTVRAERLDGTPIEGITLKNQPDGTIIYREYRTGPRPWWKRAWRRMRWG